MPFYSFLLRLRWFFFMEYSSKHFGIFLIKDSQKLPSPHVCKSPMPFYSFLLRLRWFFMEYSSKYFEIFLIKDSQKLLSPHISISPVPSYLFLLSLRWFFFWNILQNILRFSISGFINTHPLHSRIFLRLARICQ